MKKKERREEKAGSSGGVTMSHRWRGSGKVTEQTGRRWGAGVKQVEE